MDDRPRDPAAHGARRERAALFAGDLFSPADYDVFIGLDQTSRDTALEPLTLHVLSRSGYATWAAGRFTRAPDEPGFTKAEADYLAAVGRYVGAGVREYLSQTPWSDGPSRVPGVIVVSADGRIVGATPEADTWLSRLPARGCPDRRGTSTAILG